MCVHMCACMRLHCFTCLHACSTSEVRFTAAPTAPPQRQDAAPTADASADSTVQASQSAKPKQQQDTQKQEGQDQQQDAKQAGAEQVPMISVPHSLAVAPVALAVTQLRCRQRRE